MGKRFFISYNHEQRDWVRNSLLPILKASETDYYIDLERMEGGKPITSQTDRWQDDADIQVLLFSREYLESDYCIHEMERALGYDPGFTSLTTRTTQSREAGTDLCLEIVAYFSRFRPTHVLPGRKSWNNTKIFA